MNLEYEGALQIGRTLLQEGRTGREIAGIIKSKGPAVKTLCSTMRSLGFPCLAADSILYISPTHCDTPDDRMEIESDADLSLFDALAF